MIGILKHLITVLVVILFVTVGCATAVPIQKFKGNSAVLRTGNTIGMSDKELQKVLGPPIKEDTCRAPAMRKGKKIFIVGKSMLWRQEVANMEEHSYGEYDIVTCFIKDIAVAEHRAWAEINGNKIYTGSTDSIDTSLVQSIADGNFNPEKPKTKLDKILEDDPGPKFEI